MQKKLRVLLPLLVLATGIAVAAAIVKTRPSLQRQEDAVPPPLVRAVTVQQENLPLDVYSQGTVEPLTESTLVAEVAGQITRVSSAFVDGGFFRRGQTLLWIDPRDYELRVAQAEAQVAQARVALEREQAEADLARQEWQELGRGEPTALTLREPQLAGAQAQLQAAEAALEQARLDLSRTEIRAPFDGRIHEKRIDRGQFVGRGAEAATVFATDYAEIRLPVRERELAYLDIDLGGSSNSREHPSVTLSADLAGNRESWRGQVVRTDSRFDEGTRMLDLFARVEDPFALRQPGGTPLPIGLFVEARIDGSLASDVYVVPRSAVRPDGRVLVVEDGRLNYREVEILRLFGDQAVISAGLQSGEQVCISALETVVDGMSVRVQLDPEAIRIAGSDEVAP